MMPIYRIYFLSNGAQIEKGIDVDCRSDEAAVDHAERLARHHGEVQVWCGCRSLGTFPSLLDSVFRPPFLASQRRAMHWTGPAQERFLSIQSGSLDMMTVMQGPVETGRGPLRSSQAQAGAARSPGDFEDRRSGPAKP